MSFLAELKKELGRVRPQTALVLGLFHPRCKTVSLSKAHPVLVHAIFQPIKVCMMALPSSICLSSPSLVLYADLGASLTPVIQMTSKDNEYNLTLDWLLRKSTHEPLLIFLQTIRQHSLSLAFCQVFYSHLVVHLSYLNQLVYIDVVEIKLKLG